MRRDHHSRCRGFTLIEVLTVMAVAAIVAAVTFPAARDLIQARVKERTIEKAGTLLVTARDNSRRKLTCASVQYEPAACGGGSGAFTANAIDCDTGVVQAALPGTVPVDAAIVDYVYTGPWPGPGCCGPIVFDKSGGLVPVGPPNCVKGTPGCYDGPRELNIVYYGGEQYTQEVLPAVGAVRRTR